MGLYAVNLFPVVVDVSDPELWLCKLVHCIAAKAKVQQKCVLTQLVLKSPYVFAFGVCLFLFRGEGESQIAVLHPRKLNIFQLHGSTGDDNGYPLEQQHIGHACTIICCHTYMCHVR